MDIEKHIQDIFGPSGILEKHIPAYEHRSQQQQMSQEVLHALLSEDIIIIEAPTGTGKTLAYLVAAILSGKRTAISTGTKNLQEQLFYKDIPFVKANLFPDLKTALLKGRSNFLCHLRLKRFLRQPHLRGIGEPDSLKEILSWYKKTGRRGHGDRAELSGLPDDDPVWPEICSTSDTCIGKKCPDREDCFVMKMRARATASDLMVVNHHLLAADLTVRESGFGEVIPRYEALIVDEAHGLEDAATQHFGFHLSRYRILRLARDVRAFLQDFSDQYNRVDKSLKGIEDNGRALFEEYDGAPAQRSLLGRIDKATAEIRDTLIGHLKVLAAVLENLHESEEEAAMLAGRSSAIAGEVAIVLADEPESDYAVWSESRGGSVVLHASPIEVGDLLKKRLYEKVPSLVFTSATLSSAGNFEYFKNRVGLNGDPEPSETILDSPFDYQTQTLMFVPGSIPEPNARGFVDAAAELLPEILEGTGGRAFLLFTSYRNMQLLYDRMKNKVPFPVLIQGSKPKHRLLTEFREQPGAVLFATSSFWEGVDVQGEALSCVVIDRLPFAHPDDPIVSARIDHLKKQGEDWFNTFQVPMAVISLKQGLGRLIRTKSDRGVLCVLDKRILTKGYGKVFMKSLFDSPLTRKSADIKRFFDGQPPPRS